MTSGTWHFKFIYVAEFNLQMKCASLVLALTMYLILEWWGVIFKKTFPFKAKWDYNTDAVIGMYYQDQPTDQNPSLPTKWLGQKSF